MHHAIIQKTTVCTELCHRGNSLFGKLSYRFHITYIYLLTIDQVLLFNLFVCDSFVKQNVVISIHKNDANWKFCNTDAGVSNIVGSKIKKANAIQNRTKK